MLSHDGKLYIYFGNDQADRWVGGFVMPEYGVMATEDPESGDWELYPSHLEPDNVFKWATGNKLRVYTISDQDDSGPWLRKTFKDLFYIVSPGYQDFGGLASFHSTWCGISGERWYRFPSGANKDIVDNEWVEVHGVF